MLRKNFGGRAIYHVPNSLCVYQNFFYRWLTFENNNAIQTLIRRNHPQIPSLAYINPMILAVQAQPAECCLLGLGGAGIAHALSPYLPENQLVAVEISQEVIEVAKTYFMINELKNLTIINQDANLFVQQTKTHYHHLLIDLCGATHYPLQCSHYDFFAHCYRLLLPMGVMALNLTSLEYHSPILSHLREIFHHCIVSMPIAGTANIIILAYKGPTITPLLNILTQSGRLKTLFWDAHWGYMATCHSK